jgi:hypothetical protein
MDEQLDPKAKYILHYATDLKTPKGSGPSKMVSFRSLFRYVIFLMRNKTARDAIRADRSQLLIIDK